MNIFDCVNDIEKDFPVADWKVDDIDIWPIVRINLFDENDEQALSGTSKKHRLSGIINEFKLLMLSFYIFIRDFKHNDFLHKAEVFFWGYNADRTIRLSTGEVCCQNLDMIKERLKEKGYNEYMLENICNLKINIPRYGKSNVNVCFDLFKIKCKIKFMKLFGNKYDVYCPKINEVKRYLQSNGFLCNSCSELVLLNNGIHIKEYAKYFERILSRMNVKLALIVCWYSCTVMGLIYAARNKNIFCVDIQHGAAGGNNHRAYSRWYNVPQGGYNTLPTNFWCWSDDDAEAINSWYGIADGINRAFVGGRTPQSYFLDKDYGNKWIELINQTRQHGKKMVLLTLQTGVTIPLWLINYIKNSINTIQWYIRLHPATDEIQQDIVNKLKKEKNVECKIASSCPLQLLLEFAFLHITSHSSVVLEAEEYGLKSVIVSEQAVNYFKASIERKMCYFAGNAKKLDKIIEETSENMHVINHKSMETANKNGIKNLIKIIDTLR